MRRLKRFGRPAARVMLAAALVGASTAAFTEEDPRDRPYPHGEWQEDCSLCHDDAKFLPAKPTKDFKHAASLPLRGAHATASCSACHKTLDFGQLPRPDCVACHQDVHRGEFGMDCSRCHSTRTFLDRAEMSRLHRTTRFPLSGAHAAADCDACHRPKAQGQLVYVGLATDCAACHDNTGYPSAPQKPQSHVDGDLPDDCSLCHNTVSFVGGRVNHDATGFPLTGAHTALDCALCHGEPFDPNLSPECVSCHLADYQAVTDPNHVEAGFPTDCALCHTTTSFEDASFNHSTTSFPLTGAHIALDCSACHADGVYDGKSTECESCHLADYQAATDPNHVQAGFPTDCALCHTTTSFEDASFNHSTTSFPLTGSHVALDCSACHADGVYDGKSTECVSCHQDDYEATTDPRHSSASLSTDCALCHTTTTFDGARFVEHDSRYFPIYSGSHNGVWDRCSDCHVNSLNYSLFSCLGCHTQSETNRIHGGISGYQYDSAACYACHPRGVAED